MNDQELINYLQTLDDLVLNIMKVTPLEIVATVIAYRSIDVTVITEIQKAARRGFYVMIGDGNCMLICFPRVK